MGYTTNVIQKCYEDVRSELAELISDRDKIGSGEHRELSARLKRLSTLLISGVCDRYDAECDARAEAIDRRFE